VNGNPHGPHRFAQLAQERCTRAPYRDRHLYVEAKISRQEAVFVIRDEGRGFDPDVISPAIQASIEKASGRGMLLMRTFMDEVRYNSAGNEVTLIKRSSR
jgi:anti-sigma regulatory factor (Ser/Thr protein kinase)